MTIQFSFISSAELKLDKSYVLPVEECKKVIEPPHIEQIDAIPVAVDAKPVENAAEDAGEPTTTAAAPEE